MPWNAPHTGPTYAPDDPPFAQSRQFNRAAGTGSDIDVQEAWRD